MKTLTIAKQAEKLVKSEEFSINTAEQSLTISQAQDFAKEYLRLCEESIKRTGCSDPMASIMLAKSNIN